MIVALKDNNELKYFISSIYNKFRNKKEIYPYKTVMEWFRRDIICIASPSIVESIKSIDDKFEKLMEDYEGNEELDDDFDRLNNLAIEEICKLDDKSFPVIVSITRFCHFTESRLSFEFEFEFENAKGITFGNGSNVMKYLEERI